jgi:hypothetical protein
MQTTRVRTRGASAIAGMPFGGDTRGTATGVQRVRWTNLVHVLVSLEQDGHVEWDAKVAWFRGVVTPGRLAAMLTGSRIDPWFAAHIEHALGLPKGWMDAVHPQVHLPSQRTRRRAGTGAAADIGRLPAKRPFTVGYQSPAKGAGTGTAGGPKAFMCSIQPE